MVPMNLKSVSWDIMKNYFVVWELMFKFAEKHFDYEINSLFVGFYFILYRDGCVWTKRVFDTFYNKVMKSEFVIR